MSVSTNTHLTTTTTSVAATTTITNTPIIRSSLNGKWILDRNRGSPSIRGFLETMGVSDLAIEANEKGEKEHDTIHEITLTEHEYKIKKTSRVNDLTLEVILGQEHVKSLLPGERIKRTLATSDHLGHVKVESSLPTINGVAKVTDVKTLVQKNNDWGQQESIYVQQLTITNESTQKNHITTRYFTPFEGEASVTSKIAGGNKKNY